MLGAGSINQFLNQHNFVAFKGVVLCFLFCCVVVLLFFFLNLVEFVCICFILLYRSVIAQVRSFVCAPIYRYKCALFLFQRNSRKKLGEHPAGPVVRLPSCTRARAAPHLSCARGMRCQKAELIPLPRGAGAGPARREPRLFCELAQAEKADRQL